MNVLGVSFKLLVTSRGNQLGGPGDSDGPARGPGIMAAASEPCPAPSQIIRVLRLFTSSLGDVAAGLRLSPQGPRRVGRVRPGPGAGEPGPGPAGGGTVPAGANSRSPTFRVTVAATR
jgi:hypothetical protein